LVFMKTSTATLLQLTAAGGDTIDGGANIQITSPNLGVATIVSDGGTQWLSVAT
jgi:hypothetical protein